MATWKDSDWVKLKIEKIWILGTVFQAHMLWE